ncbi:radical SAM protein, partial [Sharpea azabuensis]|uniref:radical SAM protein n=1 Tax=Sharpea azabuensis TaxID=322505 RepID=UPI002409BDC1
TTSHPWDFTEEMFEAIAKYPNIMPFLHLPLQSGSNDVLRRMGRRYTAEEYCHLVDRLREIVPSISLSTDIIVGFPNETEEQFEDTLSLYEHCQYDLAYTFVYSPRAGTPAAAMEDNIPLEEKQQRLYRLNEVVNKYANQANAKYLGHIATVLVDGPSKRNPDILSGYTEHNKLINFKGNKEDIGKMVKVKITNTKTWTLEGEQIA